MNTNLNVLDLINCMIFQIYETKVDEKHLAGTCKLWVFESLNFLIMMRKDKTYINITFLKFDIINFV